MQINGKEKTVKLPEPDLERKKRGRKISLNIFLLVAVLFVLDIAIIEKLPRLCIWYRLTGTDCPFCGLVRSCVALASGSFTRSFDYHPFGAVVFAAGIFLLAGSLFTWFAGKAFSPLAWLEKNARKTAIILGTVWLAWWLTRLLF